MESREFLWAYWGLVKEACETKNDLMEYFSKTYELTQLQVLVMGQVDSLEDTSIRSIARSLRRDHGNISKICTLLEEKGFVYRQRSETDSRIVNIYLTEIGKEYVEEFRGVVSPYFEKVGEYLSDGDLRFILKSMANVEKLLNESDDVKEIRGKTKPEPSPKE
ncbi:MarR family winged helix-turn-helix transcriptional regulator [Aedoeadaptatus pacaensis]|uniref:MarR family winged helix-turn-helix transcriptional regulator n=1 Tax=Aedoeadaptatus pacaensis TaxID=1776390 RepID=UPI0008395321|nr:MarR family transcriptional regulator [Peptoniphilus pacaensis]